MNTEQSERRQGSFTHILVASRDKDWLNFARKTLRRTDHTEATESIDTIAHPPAGPEERYILMLSSEMVPAGIKEFNELLLKWNFWRVWVLCEPHDEHHRISDKHLRGLGVEVADRPENAKALRRLLKTIFS